MLGSFCLEVPFFHFPLPSGLCITSLHARRLTSSDTCIKTGLRPGKVPELGISL